MQEKMVAGELTRRMVNFYTQENFNGGRATAGGMSVDFYLPDFMAVIRVQGQYWHTRPLTMKKDDAQALYLQAQGYRVIDLWEQEIMADVRDAVGRTLGVMG